MCKFLDMHRTIDEWKELTRNMQNTHDGIVYNCLVALSGGDFGNIAGSLQDLLFDLIQAGIVEKV